MPAVSAWALYHGARFLLTHEDHNGQRIFGDMRGNTAKGVSRALHAEDWLPEDVERCADTNTMYARRTEWLGHDSAALYVPTQQGVMTHWATTAAVTVEGLAWTRRLLHSGAGALYLAAYAELRPASHLQLVSGLARTALEWLDEAPVPIL